MKVRTAKVGKEKPKMLGDRVYAKHRRMLAAIAKKRGERRAASFRFCIEDTYARIFAA